MNTNKPEKGHRKDHRLPGRRPVARATEPETTTPTADQQDDAQTQAMPWRPGAFATPATPPSAPTPAPPSVPPATAAPDHRPTRPAQQATPLPGRAAGPRDHESQPTEAMQVLPVASPTHPVEAPAPVPQTSPSAVPEVGEGTRRTDDGSLDALQAKLSKRSGQTRGAKAMGRMRALVGSDDLPTLLAGAWQREQAPFPIGRRIWVAAAHGGAGATTLAVCLAHELHARRADGAALVDAAAGRSGLADRLAAVTGTVDEALAAPVHDRSAGLLTFGPAGPAGDPDALATRLRRAAGVVLTDGGTTVPEADQVEATLLVAECSLRGVRAVLRAAAEVPGPAPLVVFTDHGGATGVTGADAVGFAERAGLSAYLLRHDTHLVTAAVIDPERLAPGTALDLATIGAATIERVAGQ